MSFLIGLMLLFTGSFIGYNVRDILPKNSTRFIKEFIKNPTEVGALMPCSDYVSNEVVKTLFELDKESLDVLEVGSGPGVITEKIVMALSGKKYNLDLVEINPFFCKKLLKKYKSNSYISIHEADITQWNSSRKYDVIISTLPFNVFDKVSIEKIWKLYFSLLKPGGKIIFIELAYLGNIGDYFVLGKPKIERLEKRALIAKYRDKYLKNKKCIYKNIPPIYVYCLEYNDPCVK